MIPILSKLTEILPLHSAARSGVPQNGKERFESLLNRSRQFQQILERFFPNLNNICHT
jgi:hypothetical protein